MVQLGGNEKLGAKSCIIYTRMRNVISLYDDDVKDISHIFNFRYLINVCNYGMIYSQIMYGPGVLRKKIIFPRFRIYSKI